MQPLSYDQLGENARLAADALAMKPTPGIPTWMLHIMDIPYLERRAGHAPGSFRKDPHTVYLDFQRAVGACLIDQYLAENPLSMGAHGFENDTAHTATTGAEHLVLDGIVIDSPEAVAEHLERVVFPALEAEIAGAAHEDSKAVARLIAHERSRQAQFGPSILKVPYSEGFQQFPYLRYTTYGYVNYLTAFVIYPEIMEKDFSLQADLAAKRNRIAARAILEGNLPKVIRMDHDMADSRGTLVDIRAIDLLWFPHFARAIRPHLDAGVRLLWHCDGNLMEMVPRLLEAGIGGFQGFQYEDGMDYPRICRMRTRDGGPLMIWAGVSVTRTLPFGGPGDVRKELEWLVNNGPARGLFLGVSSSATPGIPWENLDALIEGLAFYRTAGAADCSLLQRL